MISRLAYVLAPIALLALASTAPAQPPGSKGVKPTVLKTAPVPDAPNREFILILMEVEPGGGSGLHTHPGDEYGTVIEGTLMVKIGDKDFVPVSAGESFSASEGTPMEIKNTSQQTVRVINVLINQKGKPRSTPVKHH